MLIRSRAPLRLGLAGGGTDVSPYCDEFGGAVLNATIDYYAYAGLEPLDNGTVSFVSADQRANTDYDARPVLEPDGRLDLFKAVYNHVVRNYNGGKPLSLRMSTRVDVPAGSGLGSSSTLVVAMLAAYVEWLNLPLGDYELAHTAFVIEREEAGLPGGKQDQYAAAFGGFNFMEFGANGAVLVNPLRVKDWVVSELEASLLLYYTGKSRASGEIINEQSRNVRDKNKNAVEAMHSIKQEAIRMKECLLRGDFQLLHQVLRGSWESKKRMASQIVNDHLDRLYSTALDAGAYCAKISGAGGGGFMMFLTDPIHKDQVAQALHALQDGGAAYGCHFTAGGVQAGEFRDRRDDSIRDRLTAAMAAYRRARGIARMEAIVLAGGFGSRLAGRLDGVPKPMAPIAGRPFLEILLRQLARAGCTRCLLSVGHLHTAIQDHFGTSYSGMSIEYVIEESPLGTGGAIRASLAEAHEDSVPVLNGDTFLDADYPAMMRFHAAGGAVMTMAISHQQNVARYGAVVLRDGRIVGFAEKGTPGAGWINAGAYVLNRNLKWPPALPEKFSFETDFFAPEIERIAPLAFEVDGFFLDIGVSEDLDRAQTALAGR